MQDQNRTSEGLKETLLTSVRSTGFWSAVAGIVGLVAAAGGGILLLLIDELRNFSISVLIIGLVLLFLALVLSPRAVAIFMVGRQGRYGGNVIVMTVAFFAIAVLVNFLLFRNPTRVDITATRVFTLAPQSRQILENLAIPVRANAFFVPGDTRSTFARQQAEDLLNEFQRRSNNFTYRFIDPELNRPLALKYNVTEYPTIVFEDLNTEKQQAINIFTEPDFITAILIATGVEQKKVYYLTGHKEAASTRDFLTGNVQDEGLDFAISGMQRDNYAVLPLNLKQDGRIPEDAAVVVIAGPQQELDEQEKEALVNYIKNGNGKSENTSGGRLVMLFDPKTPQSWLDLLATWGITLGNDNIADAVSSVAGQMLTPLVQRANAQFFTSDIPIANPVGVTFFPAVTSVETVVPREDIPFYIRITPLAFTTPASWLESDPEKVNYDPGTDRRGPFVVAMVIEASGVLDETERHLPAKLVIFGDSDFAKNRFFASNDNADLFLNSINWLAEDYDIISVRPKVVPFRELVVNKRERDFIKWSSWLLPPSVMLVIGAVVWWRRR